MSILSSQAWNLIGNILKWTISAKFLRISIIELLSPTDSQKIGMRENDFPKCSWFLGRQKFSTSQKPSQI